MPYRADGYKQVGGFVVDARLHDGSDVTGYERIGSGYGAISITALYDLGESPAQAVQGLRAHISWEDVLQVEWQYSDDLVVWITPSFNSLPTPATHAGTYSGNLLLWNLNPTITARFWRLSAQNTDNVGAPTKLGIFELWASNTLDVPIAEGPGDLPGGPGGTPVPTTLIGANTADVIYSDAYLFATISGELPDGQPFGKLQDVTFDDSIAFDKLQGPGSHLALAGAYGERTVTGSARSGVLRPNGLRCLRGGTLAEASGKTTWTSKGAENAASFDLHAKSPSDGSDLEVKLYGCACTRLGFNMTTKGFLIHDFAFEALGKSTGEVIEVIFPGNKMVS